MKHSIERGQGRRELLRGAIRWLALGGVTLLSAGLMLTRRSMPVTEQCRLAAAQLPFAGASLCRGCAVWDECTLPQAAAAREPIAG